MPSMKAAIFVEPGRIVLHEKPVPDEGSLNASHRYLFPHQRDSV